MGSLYENIRQLCFAKGVSPSKMCTDIGLSKSIVSGLKNGTKTTISAPTAMKMADYLGVSVNRLLTYDGAPLPCMKDDPPRGEKNPAPTNGDGKTYKEQLLDLIDDIAAHGTRDDLVDVLAAITAAMLKK